MSTFLYWRHKHTNEIYAVRTTEDGILDGATGPISSNEAKPSQLPHWEFDSKEGQKLRAQFLEFERIRG